jgi:hypothetical protein
MLDELGFRLKKLLHRKSSFERVRLMMHLKELGIHWLRYH